MHSSGNRRNVTSCTVTTTGARAGGATKLVAWTTSTGPVQSSARGRARPALPELADDPRRDRAGRRPRMPARHRRGQRVAAAPRERVGVDVDVVASGECRQEPGGHLSDAGTVAEQRGAVDRDPQGTDRRILPVGRCPDPRSRRRHRRRLQVGAPSGRCFPGAEGSPHVRIRHLTNTIAAGLPAPSSVSASRSCPRSRPPAAGPVQATVAAQRLSGDGHGRMPGWTRPVDGAAELVGVQWQGDPDGALRDPDPDARRRHWHTVTRGRDGAGPSSRSRNRRGRGRRDHAVDRAGVGRPRGDGAGSPRARVRCATSSSTGSAARACRHRPTPRAR